MRPIAIAYGPSTGFPTARERERALIRPHTGEYLSAYIHHADTPLRIPHLYGWLVDDGS